MAIQMQPLSLHNNEGVGGVPATVLTVAERSALTKTRLNIEKLQTEQQLELSHAPDGAGLPRHPGNDEMLGTSALLAMARSDREESPALLNQLQQVQGEGAPATTCWPQARRHRCMGTASEAVAALENGLMRFPASAELQSERSLMIKPEACG